MFTILQVEDTPADVLLVADALNRGGIASDVHVVISGDQAIAFLQRRSQFSAAPRPDMILLDLNLPCVDGFEVLEFVKSDSSLMSIPTVIFSTATSDRNKARAYALHANSVVSKPDELQEYRAVIKCIAEYWSFVCINRAVV